MYRVEETKLVNQYFDTAHRKSLPSIPECKKFLQKYAGDLFVDRGPQSIQDKVKSILRQKK